jgi:F420-dependent oxidoreductase-like protein
MDLRIFVEPQQGATYGQQLAVAQTAEADGFDAFFRSDHDLKIPRVGSTDELGNPGPTDSWITLGALARETSTIRLGTMVTSATFRLPGPLAVAVAQVDEMSNGRVEIGIGAGWYDEEHTAYGIPFPTLGERFDRLEEQLEILTGMWRCPPGSQFSFEGRHYGVLGSPALPKPVQPGGPPVIIGGLGPRRTPQLAALYATEYNIPFRKPATFARQRARVSAACEAIGRDPDDLIYSAALTVVCGENDEEVKRRAANIGMMTDEFGEKGLAGKPAQILDAIADYADLGAVRIYLQLLDMGDLDQIRLIGDQVLRLLP